AKAYATNTFSTHRRLTFFLALPITGAQASKKNINTPHTYVFTLSSRRIKIEIFDTKQKLKDLNHKYTINTSINT
nr:hypothetical protein [Parachlamydiaceae bacterium]